MSWAFLDDLVQRVGVSAGNVVSAAGDAAATKVAKVIDKTPTEKTSALQNSAGNGISAYLPWIVGGGLLLVGGYFLLRRKS